MTSITQQSFTNEEKQSIDEKESTKFSDDTEIPQNETAKDIIADVLNEEEFQTIIQNGGNISTWDTIRAETNSLFTFAEHECLAFSGPSEGNKRWQSHVQIYYNSPYGHTADGRAVMTCYGEHRGYKTKAEFRVALRLCLEDIM